MKVSPSEACVVLPSPPGSLLILSGAQGEPPSQRFRKPLIRVGEFTKAADGIAFSVSRETLDHWATTFRAMKAAGAKVPVPITHTNNPAANRGWVEDMQVVGDELVAELVLNGADVLGLVPNVDVSIYVPPSKTDGLGNVYNRPIEHVALVTDPVIPGLGPFEAIAASHLSTKETGMADDKTTLAKLKELLGKDAEKLGDDDVLEAVAKRLKTASDRGTLEKEIAELKRKLENKTKEVETLALSTQRTPPDPVVLGLVRDNSRMKLDQLVQAGRLSPKAREVAEDRYLSDAALTLSLAGSGKPLEDLIEVLKINEPVALGERTGPQAMVLSRQTRNDGPNVLKAAMDRQRAAAGLKN